MFEQVDAFGVNGALAAIMDGLAATNGYLERAAPWQAAKAGQAERVATTLYTAAEVLRLAGALLAPVIPERSAELFRRLGWSAPQDLGAALGWGGLQPGSEVCVGDPLFPKIE